MSNSENYDHHLEEATILRSRVNDLRNTLANPKPSDIAVAANRLQSSINAVYADSVTASDLASRPNPTPEQQAALARITKRMNETLSKLAY